MALARGCSESFSREAAICSSSPQSTFSGQAMSVTMGCPWVMVPVLSITTVCTEWAVSRASADLMRTPLVAPRPVPTMMAVGVARPKAQGQETTSTDTAMVRANSKVAPQISHTMAETTAMAITTGTNTPATRSASLAMGALELVASSTRRMIWARAVSSPTLVARMRKYPLRLTVAPITLSPVSLSTGMLSPVMADSSTEAVPSRTTPSTGMDSPAFTISTSPVSSSSTGTTDSTPSRTTVAVLGARFKSLLMASEVFPLALASKNLPRVIRVRMVPAPSKYKSWVNWVTMARSPWPKP